jgi:hypothetical protein
MATTTPNALGSFARAPVDPDTYRSLVSLLVAFPLGVAYVTVLATGVSLTLGLSVTLLGPFALLGTLLCGAALAWGDAKLTAGLLGERIEPAFPHTGDGAVAFAKELLFARAGWAGLVYLGWRALVGIAGFVGLTTGFTLAASLLLAPAVYDRPRVYYHPPALAPETFGAALGLAGGGVLVLLATLGAVNLLGRASLGVAEALVGTEG